MWCSSGRGHQQQQRHPLSPARWTLISFARQVPTIVCIPPHYSLLSTQLCSAFLCTCTCTSRRCILHFIHNKVLSALKCLLHLMEFPDIPCSAKHYILLPCNVCPVKAGSEWVGKLCKEFGIILESDITLTLVLGRVA